jgi:hypothetical protein
VGIARGCRLDEARLLAGPGSSPVTCITLRGRDGLCRLADGETGHTWRLPTEAEFGVLQPQRHVGRFGVDAPAVTDLCATTNERPGVGAGLRQRLQRRVCRHRARGQLSSQRVSVSSTRPATCGRSRPTALGREFVRILKDRLRLAPPMRRPAAARSARAATWLRGGRSSVRQAISSLVLPPRRLPGEPHRLSAWSRELP